MTCNHVCIYCSSVYGFTRQPCLSGQHTKKVTISLMAGYEQVRQMVYYCEMLQCVVLVVGCYLCCDVLWPNIAQEKWLTCNLKLIVFCAGWSGAML